MIKKIVTTLVPVFVLAVSVSAHAAGQFGFDFSASNPTDQLAWIQTEETTQVAVIGVEKTKQASKADSSWDPLGVATSASKTASSVKVKVKKEQATLLKQVSAKKRDSSIWDSIH